MAEQPYQSLYRRYRPQRFDEVRGQQHVTLALRNAVREDKVAHAYLFSGPRGTGKTSTARILAKALNCDGLQDGEPCGQCPSCLEITKGASLDVHELDAASNNGVDAMRDLVARASLGTPGRSKVYIVDEVHMLSAAASNALLKTLEEPPAHVVFVLATTEPQKVLPTVRSRTQHFEFHLLGPELLVQLLQEVRRDAALEVTDVALEAAVRRGNGSARDSLSALDQAAAGPIADEAASLDEALEALAAQDPARALRWVADAAGAGLDPHRASTELVGRLHQGFLALMAPDLVSLPPLDRERLGEQARRLGPAAVVRAMEVLGKTQVDLRDAIDPRVGLEVALVRLTRPDLDSSLASLHERLERLERRLSTMPEHPSPTMPEHPAPTMQEHPAPAPEEGHQEERSGPEPNDPRAGENRLAKQSPPASPGEAPTPRRGEHAVESSASAAPPSLGLFRARARGGGGGWTPPAGAAATPPGGTAEESEPTVGSSTDARQRAGPIAAPPSTAPPSPAPRWPTREELVMAWGDHVLVSLRGRAKAVYPSGRFIAMADGVAVFALPDETIRSYSEACRADVEAALSSHLGVPLRLRLVVDPGPAPPPSEPARDAPDDELTDEAAKPLSPAERLLQVFPGAQEL